MFGLFTLIIILTIGVYILFSIIYDIIFNYDKLLELRKKNIAKKYNRVADKQIDGRKEKCRNTPEMPLRENKEIVQNSTYQQYDYPIEEVSDTNLIDKFLFNKHHFEPRINPWHLRNQNQKKIEDYRVKKAREILNDAEDIKSNNVDLNNENLANSIWIEKADQLNNFIKFRKRLPQKDEPFYYFLQEQRLLYNSKKLSHFQLNKLESIKSDIFDKSKIITNDFKNVYLFYGPDGTNIKNRKSALLIANWRKKMKIYYRDNLLSKEQIDILNKTDRSILWDSDTKYYKKWMENYNILKKFYKLNRRLPLTKEMKWLPQQRYKFKQNKLTEKQTTLLKKIDENIFK